RSWRSWSCSSSRGWSWARSAGERACRLGPGPGARGGRDRPRPGAQGARAGGDRAGRGRAARPGVPPRPRPEQGRRLRGPGRRGRRRPRGHAGGAGGGGDLVRPRAGAAVSLAGRRLARGRSDREPGRPHPPGIRHRLPRPAALARVQPRGRHDHRGRHRPRAGIPLSAAGGGGHGLGAPVTPKPRIVHADEHLAVVDKPAGLVVHAAPGVRGPTLVDLLGGLLGGGDPGRPGIVHRLDRDTSGLMLVARTEAAHRLLSARIARREVERTYLALVEGRPRSRTGTIDAPLGRDYRAPERRAVGGRGARPARTHFAVVEALPGDSLLEVRLETGRTHQVRAHL